MPLPGYGVESLTSVRVIATMAVVALVCTFQKGLMSTRRAANAWGAATIRFYAS